MSSADLLGGASAGVSRSVTMVTDLPILGSGSQAQIKNTVIILVCVYVCQAERGCASFWM